MNADLMRTALKTMILPNCLSPDATREVSCANSGICPIFYTYLGCTRQTRKPSGRPPGFFSSHPESPCVMTAQPRILIKARRSMSLKNGLRDTGEDDQTYNCQNL